MNDDGTNRLDRDLDLLSDRLATGTLHEALPAPEVEVDADSMRAADDDGAASGGTGNVSAADVSGTADSLLRAGEPFPYDTLLHGYVASTRDMPLLTHDEEMALGRTISESRETLTQALARVPLAASMLVEATAEARAGDRRLSDVYQFPYRTGSAGPGARRAGRKSGGTRSTAGAGACYLQVDLVEAALASVRAHDEPGVPETRSLRELRAHLASTFTSLQPGYPLLRRALDRCVAMDREVRTIESGAGAGVAELLARPARARRALPAGVRPGSDTRHRIARLEALRAELGVDLEVVREVCADGVAAERALREARRRMVESNVRLAYFMARKLMGQGVASEDLVQEAILGLMRAAEKYDYRLGWRFSTYACEWIWQGITRAIAESSRTVRVPAHVHDVIVRLRKETATLSQRLGRTPTPEELAETSGVPEDKVRRALRASTRPVSLSTPMFDDESATLELCLYDPDQTDPSDEAAEAHLTRRVAELLDGLAPREAMVLKLRHGIGGSEPRTLDEVGRVLGISRERTRQLESRALSQLRASADPALIDALSA